MPFHLSDWVSVDDWRDELQSKRELDQAIAQVRKIVADSILKKLTYLSLA